MIGTVLETARKTLSTLLHAIFYRQSELNRDVLLTLEALTRDSEARRSAHNALSARIEELERTVARLDASRE